MKSLELPPCYGISARIDQDGDLVITMDGEVSVYLTADQAGALASWIDECVQQGWEPTK
jgi:hypothetical protein